jgi:hypothetical protein
MSILNPLTSSDTIETWFTRTNQGITFLNYINNGCRPPVRDIISIKDIVFNGLSAAGDGVTDDTTVIKAALDARPTSSVSIHSKGITANIINEGYALYFPPGVYRMTEAAHNNSQFTAIITNAGNGPNAQVFMFGDKAKILYEPLPCSDPKAFCDVNGINIHEYSRFNWGVRKSLFTFSHTAKNITIHGLEFDCNNKAKCPLEIADQGGGERSLISISDCTFKNTKSGTNSGTSSDTNAGLIITGGGLFTNIHNCKFINHTRYKGSGAPRNRTTAGVLFTSIGTPPNAKVNRHVNITGCYFENITNDEIGNDPKNTDCDAITLIGGLDEDPTKYSLYSATISNNHFRNCKGRSLKIQSNMISFMNNIVYRNIPALETGFAEVNAQALAAVNLSNNIFIYDQIAGGGSPFSNDGSINSLSTVIDCSTGEAGNTKTVTIADNVVLNNVPKNIGVLTSFFAARFSPKIVDPFNSLVTVTGNKIIGGTVQFFGQVNTLTPSDNNKVFYNIHDNMITEIGDFAGKTFAFLSGQGGDGILGFYKNIFNITNNVHTTAKTVKHLISPDSLITYEGNVSAYNNINIGISLTSPLGDAIASHNTQKSFIPRIGKLTDDSKLGNAICSQTVQLENNAPYHTFNSCGQPGAGKIRMITSNWGHPGTFIFAQNGVSNTYIPAGFTGADIVVHPNTNSSTDGKLNVVFGSGDVSVRNLLGSTRNISLHTFG